MKLRFGLLLAVAVLAAIAGCGTPGAAGPADSFGLDFTLPDEAVKNGAILFFMDGVNAGVFQEMLEAGELPAFREYFVDRGLYSPRSVANIPSVTLANMTSFVTGQFPGHHGVTGVNWFDRNPLIWRNYDTISQKNTLDGDYTAGNIYEQFPDRTTFSIFLQPHRGTTKFVENWTSAGPPFFFRWFEFVDRITLHRFQIVADVARKREEFPAVTTVYLLATDFRGYERGPGSKEYREALRHADRQIGRVLGDLRRAGLLDKLVIGMTADHGMTEANHFCDLETFLRKDLGLDLSAQYLWEKTPFERRLAEYDAHAGVLYGSGERYMAVCLRRPVRKDGKVVGFESWLVRPTPQDLAAYPTSHGEEDLLAKILSQDGVDSVAYACGADCVRVRRRGGEVEFRQEGGRGRAITYRAISGDDPLAWSKVVPADLLKSGGSPEQWLRATVASEYPDLPEQILAYFRARRAGDIAVFAATGWDFRGRSHGGHGGLCPGDMFVPLLLAGPGIPHQRLELSRSVDIMPTVVTIFGRPVPPGIDGRNLIETK